MTNLFGTLDLGAKFAIVLAGLFVGVVFLGYGRLLYNKRKIEKLLSKQAEVPKDEEAKIESIALTMTQSNEPEEADLFGVRALERGYFGGIAQSRPGTPSPSSSRGSIFRIPYGKPPQTTVTAASDPGTGKAVLGNRKNSDPDAIEEIDPRPSQLLAAHPPLVSSDSSTHLNNPHSIMGSPRSEVFASIAPQIQAPTPARRNPFVPSGTQSPRAVPQPREPLPIQHSGSIHTLVKEPNPPPNQLPRPQLSPKLSTNITGDRTDSGSCRVH